MDNNKIISSMASAFVESSNGLICPPKVATIYRIASRTVLLPALENEWLFKLISDSLDFAIYTAACLLQNNEKEPDKDLIQAIERDYTPRELCDIITEGLSGITVEQITLLFELNKNNKGNKKPSEKADSVIHRQIGSFIKYFGFSEYEAKFQVTWSNYLLYMNSIPGEEAKPQTDENGVEIFKDGKNRYPVKDANDIF